MLWTMAAARLVFGPHAEHPGAAESQPGRTAELIAAGINDWGGVSPVTPDHVNPEAPWPQIEELARERATRASAGRTSRGLSGISRRAERWLDPRFHRACCRDATRMASRAHDDWAPARRCALPAPRRPMRRASLARRAARVGIVATRRAVGERLRETRDRAPVRGARRGFRRGLRAPPTRCARAERATSSRYVVNRNINYTNVCGYKCSFCAFSKGSGDERCAGRPYDLDLTKSSAARSKPGSAARPKSACRAASIPTIPARPIWDLRARQGGGAGHARPCFFAARSLAGRDARSGCRCENT